MSESVIFNSSLILMLYGLALAIDLIGLIKKTGLFLPVLSGFIVVGTTAYALLNGAGLYEAAFVILIFLLINLRTARGTEE